MSGVPRFHTGRVALDDAASPGLARRGMAPATPEPAAAPPPADRDAERSVIERHLLQQAGRYCERDVHDARVELLRSSLRAAARLYWYRVGDAGGVRTVVVKVPCEPADSTLAGGAVRPRLLEPPPLATKYAAEYRALELLQRHFANLDHERFGAVPLLGRIDTVGALVMAEANGRSLNELMPGIARIHPGRPAPLLRRAVENAGGWLRAYHGLELEGAEARHAGREDFLANVERYRGHLAEQLGRRAFLDELARRMSAAARRALPVTLPLGLAHGDFAPRNVLVGERGRVVVFDTAAYRRTPVYADLAKFGLAMRLSRGQTFSHGAAFSDRSVRRVERWLFTGYYGGEPVPETQIRLYALLLLLDKWSFELALPQRGPRLVDRARRRLIDAWYARQAREMVRCVD